LKHVQHGVLACASCVAVAFTPKGGCPLKPHHALKTRQDGALVVAFTPKGGCPLKHAVCASRKSEHSRERSIHPQGWVPIETLTTSSRVRHDLHHP